MTETKTKTISDVFREFCKLKREALKYSQPDLAEKVYGKRNRHSFINTIESGAKNPTLKTMGQILTGLNSWMMFGTNPDIKHNSLSEQFSRFLFARRYELGYTQEDVAERVYGDRRRRSFIDEIENGKRSPNLNTVQYILEALDSWIEFLE